MLLNHLNSVRSQVNCLGYFNQHRLFSLRNILRQTVRPQELNVNEQSKVKITTSVPSTDDPVMGELFPSARVVPMVLTTKEPMILSFEDVPGPKSLKYLSSVRNYLSEIGTQLTAGALTLGLNIGAYINAKKPLKNLSVLFDEYGPVVRFVSPVGSDIVLLNHPDHIQKVYTMEGEYPVRSTLDSLEKYRKEHRTHIYGGLFTSHGQEWNRQRTMMYTPLHNAISNHLEGVNDVCDNFVRKVYNIKNHQDEVGKDLYKELHKWSFDCMGLILFSKRFTMLETELVYSQCDMSWLYHSLEKATDAIIRCETGLHLWKLFTTPAWSSLVKYCDSLDNLIGKHVLEAEQSITYRNREDDSLSEHYKAFYHKDRDPNEHTKSLINAILLGDQKMSPEDISTVIMDMLLIGVNTIASSMAFLLYHLSKYHRAQRLLYSEIQKAYPNPELVDVKNVRNETPYLQACIKETLRLVPPIPVLTRILSKNITLDKYNIPRGTLIIMSTQDASLKEANYEDAKVFQPERWLRPDAKEYHAFASIPFGYGARKCLGQNIAETMMSLLTIKLLQKYKLEYHYGDIEPKRTFIAIPNRPLKIRFIDRLTP